MPYIIDFMESPIGIIQMKADQDFLYELDILEKDTTIAVSGNENNITCQCKTELSEYFEGKRTVFSIPIQIKGTTFQIHTWNHIKQIPHGKTISYQDLSLLLGNPKVIRAAASANGKNPILLIIPCHRVMGKNGELTGYKRGLWRKRWLLEHELKISKGLRSLFDQ